MKPSSKNLWQRIVDDFKQKDLLSVKLLYFVHTSSMSIVYPYITVFMEDLGINTQEIGILSFIISFIGIFLPPITGIVADKIGNFKRLVATIMVLGGFTALLLLLVPKARISKHYPDQLMVSVDCTVDNDFSFVLEEGERCYHSSVSKNSRYKYATGCIEKKSSTGNIGVTLHSCGLMCTDNDWSTQGASLIRTKNYTVSITDAENTTLTREFGILGKNFLLNWSAIQGRSKPYDNTVQAFRSSEYFFPTPNLFQLTCNKSFCSMSKIEENVTSDSTQNTIKFPFLTHVLNDNLIEKFSYSANKSEDLRCRQQVWKTSVLVNLNADNDTDTDSLAFSECRPQCIAKVARTNQCNETALKEDKNVKLTLYAILSGRVALAVISGSALAMVDGAIIGILRKKNADYGLQHVYSSIGGMIAGQVSGILIDAFSTGRQRNYRPAFFFYMVIKFISAIIMMNVDLEFKTPAKRVVRDVVSVLRNVETISLLIVCFMYGISYGVIETYLFPFLNGLDASAGLQGTTILVGKLSGIPFIICSGPILEYFGHANVLSFGFIVYAIRLAGYSAITQAWQCLIFEIMESITVSLGFTALVTYAAKLSSSRTDTTIQGLVGGLYHGFGKGFGSLISGFLIKSYCYRNMFRIFSVITVIFSIGYFIFYRLCIVGRSSDKGDEETNGSNNSMKMKSSGQVNPAYVCDENSINAEQK